MRRWLSQLHVRLALLAAALMALAGLVLWSLSVAHGERSALEASQRLQRNLAADIVKHQPRPLIGDDGRADAELVHNLAMMAMKINPAIEVHLLDAQGRSIAHALEGVGKLDARVDLLRVRELLAAGGPSMWPVLGDDPRRPGRSTIVSVAPVGDAASPRGYVYVVLQGAEHEAVRATLDSSRALRGAAAAIAVVLLGAAFVFVLVLTRLTQPLRRLTREVEDFRSEGDVGDMGDMGDMGDTGEAAGGDGGATRERAPARAVSDIDGLAHATRAMRERIADQFKRLEDNDRLRRELIGNISHDLHTPLASVQGYIETVLLRGDALDAAAREQYLRTALAHARRLDRRIVDLFELSKLDAGRVQPKVEPFRLAELLQDVVQSYRLQGQQRGVTLEFDAGSLGHALVRADIALIERVLQNLVDNALRYTPEGGRVRLAIEATDAGHVTLSVSDTGVGIAPEHLPHVFERYWRAEEARAGDAPSRSAGLGLAIVKRIVELHGSAIRVRSTLRAGTTFEFALPQAA
jgi:two-component system, OmpR family, sensor kinase